MFPRQRFQVECLPKKWLVFERNQFLFYYNERSKFNDQGVVASPTALVPANYERALLNLEEEKWKNLIFNGEERKKSILHNEQDNSLIVSDQTSQVQKNLEKELVGRSGPHYQFLGRPARSCVGENQASEVGAVARDFLDWVLYLPDAL
jgi:hypothetical protein